jgi:hypothetical protein
MKRRTSHPPSLTLPTLRLQVASLDPATHAYSFWEGVPRDGKAAFGRLFRTSQTLKVRPPLVAARVQSLVLHCVAC